jgi:hypothetical protein
VDVLTPPWGGTRNFWNPPLKLIPLVVEKIAREAASGLLVTPSGQLRHGGPCSHRWRSAGRRSQPKNSTFPRTGPPAAGGRLRGALLSGKPKPRGPGCSNTKTEIGKRAPTKATRLYDRER